MFAPLATVAAFKNGEEWRTQMLKYTEGNIEFVINYCKENIPQIRPIRPEASFLVWLDCTELNLSHKELIDLFVNKARLALNDGEMFGTGGKGFMRLNVGTQRAVLRQAMQQLKDAVEQVSKK
jgi:cystathionine beta-lyase